MLEKHFLLKPQNEWFPLKNYSSAPNINLGERVGYIKKRYMFNKPINKISQRTFSSHLLFYPLPNISLHYIIRCKVRKCINDVNTQTIIDIIF